MSISFNGIPGNLRVPFVYVEFDASRAQQGPSTMPYRCLIVGQRLATGTVAELVPTRVTSAAQARTYFGRGSMLARMCELQLANNGVTECWAVALTDNAAGVQAAGSIAFGGPASAAGTIYAYVAGQRLTIGVTAGMTAAAMASALVAAVTAAPDLPVTAVVDGVNTAKVNLTARHKGAAGNDIDLRVNYYDAEVLPGSVTASIIGMSGGATNPTVDPIWAALGDEQYHVITWPYTDAASLVSLEGELSSRFGPLRQIDGVAISSATGSHSGLATLGSGRNSPHVSIMHAHGVPNPTWEVASAVAGVVSYYGNIDPARPFQTLGLTGILPPRKIDRFTLAENNLLLFDGISTFSVDAGGVVRLQRVITTYQVTANGADDISYLDLNTPLTLSYLRYDWRNLVLRRYPRHKLANDGTAYGAGQAIVTPKVMKAEAVAWFRMMEERGLVENIDQFKADLIIERNASDPNRLDMYMPPDLVNQLRVVAVQLGFRL